MTACSWWTLPLRRPATAPTCAISTPGPNRRRASRSKIPDFDPDIHLLKPSQRICPTGPRPPPGLLVSRRVAGPLIEGKRPDDHVEAASASLVQPPNSVDPGRAVVAWRPGDVQLQPVWSIHLCPVSCHYRAQPVENRCLGMATLLLDAFQVGLRWHRRVVPPGTYVALVEEASRYGHELVPRSGHVDIGQIEVHVGGDFTDRFSRRCFCVYLERTFSGRGDDVEAVKAPWPQVRHDCREESAEILGRV